MSTLRWAEEGVERKHEDYRRSRLPWVRFEGRTDESELCCCVGKWLKNQVQKTISSDLLYRGCIEQLIMVKELLVRAPGKFPSLEYLQDTREYTASENMWI